MNQLFSDSDRILAVNPYFYDLKESDSEFVKGVLPALADKMVEQGIVFEEDFDELLSAREGVDNHVSPSERFMHLNVKSVNSSVA